MWINWFIGLHPSTTSHDRQVQHLQGQGLRSTTGTPWAILWSSSSSWGQVDTKTETGGHQNQWMIVWLRHKRWVELLWGAQTTATPSSMVESCRAVLWICIYVPMYATTMSCTKIREIHYSSSPFSWYLGMISCPCKIYTKPQWDQSRRILWL